MLNAVYLGSSARAGWHCHPLGCFNSKLSRGHSGYVVETLKQPLLLPKDMDTLRRFKQPDLFLSLKRDLVMVSNLTYL